MLLLLIEELVPDSLKVILIFLILVSKETTLNYQEVWHQLMNITLLLMMMYAPVLLKLYVMVTDMVLMLLELSEVKLLDTVSQQLFTP